MRQTTKAVAEAVNASHEADQRIAREVESLISWSEKYQLHLENIRRDTIAEINARHEQTMNELNVFRGKCDGIKQELYGSVIEESRQPYNVIDGGRAG
jgi:hypothetical protein